MDARALKQRPAVPPGPYLVAGLGRAGLAAAEALAELAGPEAVTAWDASGAGAPSAAGDRLRSRGVRVALGGDGEALARAAACVVKSPGIAPSSPVVTAAAIDELELGWRLLNAPLIGITGTDGKSTTAKLIAAATGAPEPCGNSETGPPLSAVPGDARGPVVCEISSYQLEGCPNLVADLAVLTNLSRDHLHRHGTMEAYAACKRRLFVRPEAVAPLAVVGVDDDFGRELAADLERAGSRVARVGMAPATDYRLLSCEWDLNTCRLRAATPDGETELTLRMPGRHNALNALSALAAADLAGVTRADAIEAIGACEAVPGRFERIAHDGGFDAIVDYAHTPAALRVALETARAVTERRGTRLHAVVSSAGRHDPGKRPAMGAAAAELADRVVFTTGALYGESSGSVLADLVAGAADRDGPEPLVEADRRAAFELALEAAEPGDVVVVTGRGALPVMRDSQDGQGVPFDDREVVRELLRRGR